MKERFPIKPKCQISETCEPTYKDMFKRKISMVGNHKLVQQKMIQKLSIKTN